MSEAVDRVETKYDSDREAKLLHEIKFLRERVTNLEVFKQNFFLNHAELIQTHEKLAQLEQQLELSKIKDRIVDLPDGDTIDKSDDDFLDYFKNSLSAEEYSAVVASVFNSVEGLGIDVTVQITLHDKVKNHTLDDSTKDENIQLINQFKDQGEVVEEEDYIVFNFPHLSLLARQLPVEEVGRKSKVKHFLYVVSIGTNSRIDFLYKDSELKLLKNNIYKIFKKTRQSFKTMQDNLDSQVVSVSELFLKFEDELTECLKSNDLPEKNIKLTGELMKNTKAELNLLLTNGLTLDGDFLGAIIKLERAYSKHYSIQS